jgi:CheY-like chemotaxis protein
MNIETLPIDAVHEYDRNPRTINDAAIDAVAKSIEAFGFKVPILIDAEGVIIACDGVLASGMDRLLDRLGNAGIWLPVIAASHAPDVDDVVQAIRAGALDYLRLPLTVRRRWSRAGSRASSANCVAALSACPRIPTPLAGARSSFTLRLFPHMRGSRNPIRFLCWWGVQVSLRCGSPPTWSRCSRGSMRVVTLSSSTSAGPDAPTHCTAMHPPAPVG